MSAPSPLHRKDILFVSVQFVLFVLYLFRIPSLDFPMPDLLRYAGAILCIAGGTVLVLALATLNTNLSPFPTPRHNAALVQNGIYQYIRHPIYTGILLFAFGYAGYSENTLRFLVFFALLFLFSRKARYEEQLLEQKYPEYRQYKEESGMFLPKLH
jgi:protein-S-isoprenylcysteine O-methyltransferase Ste14